jgi:hypothetical protein
MPPFTHLALCQPTRRHSLLLHRYSSIWLQTLILSETRNTTSISSIFSCVHLTTAEDAAHWLMGFQVEGCLFKVPRQPFENNSQIFRDMFGMPEIVDSPREGSSDEHPLRLEGVKSWNFEQLLRVMLTP